MAFYRRAFLYLWRKRGKSLLLLLIFLFINTMILSTSLILRATEETKAAMQETPTQTSENNGNESSVISFF